MIRLRIARERLPAGYAAVFARLASGTVLIIDRSLAAVQARDAAVIALAQDERPSAVELISIARVEQIERILRRAGLMRRSSER